MFYVSMMVWDLERGWYLKRWLFYSGGIARKFLLRCMAESDKEQVSGGRISSHGEIQMDPYVKGVWE